MEANIADVSPRSHIGSVTTPILFIHGEADTNVPVSMAQELFAAGTGSAAVNGPAGSDKDGLWRIELFPGADHSMSYVSDPARYRRVVLEFIGQAEKARQDGQKH
jgi:dipeptidyl aminopeptidase/acylaminoacyl peptidase